MRVAPATLLIPLLGLASASAGDEPAPKPAASPPAAPARAYESIPLPSARLTPPEFDAAREAEALAFVREHHPELAAVLDSLRPMDPAEYRKAIAELSQVARTLAAQRDRNPERYARSLAVWKAKSRVELLAARLAGSSDEALKTQLRAAVEARVDAEIARQRLDLEQAEAAARRAREALERLEGHRDTVVEARLRALQPRKSARARKPATPTTKPAAAATKPDPTGEDRR